jgi:hypothetical protein
MSLETMPVSGLNAEMGKALETMSVTVLIAEMDISLSDAASNWTEYRDGQVS